MQCLRFLKISIRTSGRPTNKRTNGQVLRATQFRASVSSRREPRKENIAGEFYVDHTCIDCDTCRWMAPTHFSRQNDQSAVTLQPQSKEERLMAMKALLSCPTSSIHTRIKSSDLLQEAQDGLPAPIPGVEGVYHCGWHDVSNFACACFFIVRSPEEGNILVDSPRYNEVLARRIEALGGARFLLLTHRDDVGAHKEWAERLGVTRILHREDLEPRTKDVEVVLEGDGPWRMDDIAAWWQQQQQARDSSEQPPPSKVPPPSDTSSSSSSSPEIIFTPGHTEGHVCLYCPTTKSLFAGDHLSSPPNEQDPETLYIYQHFNWFSLPLQLESVEKLRHYDWLYVLPGHGRIATMRDAAHREQALDDLLAKHANT